MAQERGSANDATMLLRSASNPPGEATMPSGYALSSCVERMLPPSSKVFYVPHLQEATSGVPNGRLSASNGKPAAGFRESDLTDMFALFAAAFRFSPWRGVLLLDVFSLYKMTLLAVFRIPGVRTRMIDDKRAIPLLSFCSLHAVVWWHRDRIGGSRGQRC